MSFRNEVHGWVMSSIGGTVKDIISVMIFFIMVFITLPLYIVSYLINKNLVNPMWSKYAEVSFP